MRVFSVLLCVVAASARMSVQENRRADRATKKRFTMKCRRMPGAAAARWPCGFGEQCKKTMIAMAHHRRRRRLRGKKEISWERASSQPRRARPIATVAILVATAALPVSKVSGVVQVEAHVFQTCTSTTATQWRRSQPIWNVSWDATIVRYTSKCLGRLRPTRQATASHYSAHGLLLVHTAEFDL